MTLFTRVSNSLLSIAVAMLFAIQGQAQLTARDFGNNRGKQSQNRDIFGHAHDSIDEKTVPKGLYVWNVDERFGTIVPIEPDTVQHLFQNSNQTAGMYGNFNFLGGIGSPRINRIYDGRQDFMMGSQFIFTKPYSFFLFPNSKFVFTNTKSPIADLYYYSSGDKTDGDDHFKARFATNINKQAGIGFDIDYIYARGFYRNQSHSSFGATLYGSYRGDQYQMHSFYTTGYTKNLENGGIEDENYINNPESFPTTYRPADMPMRLEGVRNNVSIDKFFLTHRYSMGFYEKSDSTGHIVSRSLKATSDTTTNRKSTKLVDQKGNIIPDSLLITKFVPVASIIHTANIESNYRTFSSQKNIDNYFISSPYLSGKIANDSTHYISVQNTVALEMREGFRKWVKTGMRLFAKHELARFTLPNTKGTVDATTTNYFTLGAQLLRAQSKRFRYNVLGEIRTTGADWGEFNVEGQTGLHFKLWGDTLTLQTGGFIRNESPSFYYQSYHSRYAWWDENLNKIFRARVEGSFSFHKAKLKIGIESIQNHVFLQEKQEDGEKGTLATRKYGIEVAQSSQNIQVLSATLSHALRWGILNWENEWTFQQSSESTLPLPKLNIWSNVFLRFRIAKVLDTELGADVRYFTEYYAPAYSPAIGLFAVQSPSHRTLIGNYPWINAYLNFKLKGVRFYLAYNHLNQSEGRYFLVPHYPTNQRMLQFGICWTFFN
jgi:hypothetical protein